MARSTTSRQPMRMCIAQRRPKPREQLLRVVVDPADASRIIPDPRAVVPGRGAWIEPTLACYEQAAKKRAFGRALKVSAQADTSPVRVYIASRELASHVADPAVGRGGQDETKGRFEH